MVKYHYLKAHKVHASVSSKKPSAITTHRTPSVPTPPPPPTEEMDTESDDPILGPEYPAMDIDYLTPGELPLPIDSDEEGEDEWESESALSDPSSEVLVGEDDDDVVPSSFDFPIDIYPSNDSSWSEEIPPDLSLRSQEHHRPSPKRVYGSDSEYTYWFTFRNRRLTWAVGLTYPSPLSDFGYALNEDVKAVICFGCSRGVPIDMLISHSKIRHPGRAIFSSQEQAEVIEGLTSYRTSKAEKYDQAPGGRPVDGLEVIQGFRCPLLNADGHECSKAFVAESTFVRHLSSHPDPKDSKPHPASCASDIQTLFSQGGKQRYFSVDPTLSNLDPLSTSAHAYAVKKLPSLPKPNIPTPEHDNDRASIHWFTRWPELLKPYTTGATSITFLQSLVSFPDPASDPEWLIKLRDHGCRWWKVAEAAHIGCSHRASVMLKSHQE